VNPTCTTVTPTIAASATAGAVHAIVTAELVPGELAVGPLGLGAGDGAAVVANPPGTPVGLAVEAVSHAGRSVGHDAES
jgi:hypothetical protein